MASMATLLAGVVIVLHQKSRRQKCAKSLRENFEQPLMDHQNTVASLYGYREDGYDTTPRSTVKTCDHGEGYMGSNRWCDCGVGSPRDAERYGVSAISRLNGGANPRTKIPPRMVPPITDVEEWGTDDYTIHSAINDYRSDDLSLSGYQTSSLPLPEDRSCRIPSTCSPVTFERENFQILQNYAISRVPSGHGRSSTTWSHPTGDDPEVVYDPRMIGYSDPARGYVDKLLGQPKFYYDDINSSRASNYITRNKIDMYAFGESTGRLKNPDAVFSCDVNRLAVDEFHNSALMHREDLMGSLMAKRNREMMQVREFPISTNGQRMLGSRAKI